MMKFALAVTTLLSSVLTAAASEALPSVTDDDVSKIKKRTSPSGNVHHQHLSSLPPNSESCHLWMAPSSTATDTRARYGLFAGVDYTAGEVLPSFGEIAIPFVDFITDANRQNSKINSDMLSYLESHMWTGDFAGPAKSEGNHSTTVLVPGIGSLVQYHAGYTNVDWNQESTISSHPERSISPGEPSLARGAITPYHNMTIKATQNITAGMELFANYGDVWDRKDEDLYQETLTRKDYDMADKVLKSLMQLINDHADEFEKNATLAQNVIDFSLDNLLELAAGKRAKVVRSLLPPRLDKLKLIMEKYQGSTFLHRNRELRQSPDWLQQHGFCIDHLYAKSSNIPGAGRGLFTSKSFKRGDAIMPIPVLPLANRKLLEMYQIEKRPDGRLEYNFDEPWGHQLALNYAIGHPESSILLWPTAPLVSLVNHGSVDQGKANAYLEWETDDADFGSDMDLYDLELQDFRAHSAYNLVLRLEAISDINPGDEILIDYGPEWRVAFNSYAAKFQHKTSNVKWPLRAEELRVLFQTEPFPVSLHEDSNPYPPGIATACFVILEEADDGTPRTTDDGVDILKYAGPNSLEEVAGQQMDYCDLLARKEDEKHGYTYTIRTTFGKEVVQVDNVPQFAITVVHQPYQSDLHLKGAFRHFIGMEDVRWPQMWRDLRE